MPRQVAKADAQIANGRVEGLHDSPPFPSHLPPTAHALDKALMLSVPAHQHPLHACRVRSAPALPVGPRQVVRPESNCMCDFKWILIVYDNTTSLTGQPAANH